MSLVIFNTAEKMPTKALICTHIKTFVAVWYSSSVQYLVAAHYIVLKVPCVFGVACRV